MNVLKKLSNQCFWALVIKELNQVLQDKHLIISLIISPLIHLLINAYALNPDIQNLKLGIVDYAQTYQSRELISAFTENNIFINETYFFNEDKLEEQVRQGKLTVGIIIFSDFAKQLSNNQTAEVQVFIDAVDANTAGITNGYIGQIIQQYNEQLIVDSEACTECNQNLISIKTQTKFLYNPGLISSWFFVPGVMGLVYTLVSLVISTAMMIREKDIGTLEQLLMTPAEAWEILLAKIVPLFILLISNVTLALLVARVIFHVPFRGNLLLFYILSAIYICVGIGLGMMIATITHNQTQAFLTSFFINLPLIQLSGAISPVESMPDFMRYLSLFDPLTHYVVIIRGIMLRGVGLEVLWQNALVLLGFALVILSMSIGGVAKMLK